MEAQLLKDVLRSPGAELTQKISTMPSLSIQEKISRLATTPTLADVEFVFPDPCLEDPLSNTQIIVAPISAHKTILRASSPVFTALIDSAEKLQPNTKILQIMVPSDAGVTHDGLRELLRYIYGDVLTQLRSDLLLPVLKAAVVFQVQALVERCISEIEATLSQYNFIDRYRCLSDLGLSYSCIVLYLARNFTDVSAKLTSLRQIPRKLLEEVLNSDDLEMVERDLFDLLVVRTMADAKDFEARSEGAERKEEGKESNTGDRVIEYDENGYAIDGDEGIDFVLCPQNDARLKKENVKCLLLFLKFVRFGLMSKETIGEIRSGNFVPHAILEDILARKSPYCDQKPRNAPLVMSIRSDSGYISNLLQLSPVRSFIYSLLPQSIVRAGATLRQIPCSPTNIRYDNIKTQGKVITLILYVTEGGYVVGVITCYEPKQKFLIALHNQQGGMAAWKLKPFTEMTVSQKTILTLDKVFEARQCNLSVAYDEADKTIDVAGNPFTSSRFAGASQCKITDLKVYEITGKL